MKWLGLQEVVDRTIRKAGSDWSNGLPMVTTYTVHGGFQVNYGTSPYSKKKQSILIRMAHGFLQVL